MQGELQDMKQQAEQLEGRVTPFGFKQALNERFKLTTLDYEQFIKDAHKDAKTSMKDRDKL